MSDPYSSQPQMPNQPYSGQPHHYQQQPPQPGGPPTEPWQPSYGQPYGQQPPQPMYQQPGYGPQIPAIYSPQPPAKKRRTGLIVGVIVGVVALLGCSGIVVAALTLGKDDKTGSSTAAAKPVTLEAPATIGTLKKSSDQSEAKKMSSRLSDAGVDRPYAAVYRDTKNPSRRVIVWGGTGKIFNVGGAQRQLDSFFSGSNSELGGAKPAAVDAGSLGGKAECAKSGLSGAKISICAWVGTDVLLGFIVNGVEPDAAAAQMRTMLPSIVSR